MLKKTVDRYQHGSVRKVKRAQGFAWEFRYYVMEGSVRKPKVQTFDSAIYKTEKALRQHLESFVVKLNEKTEYARSAGVTFGALLDRYIAEEMPQRKSTKGGYLSIINSKLRPQWGSLLLSEIRPAQVHTWLQELDLAPVTKGHIKSLMHKLFDLATLWEYLPLERRNPIEIVKVKNVTMRTNEVLVLSAEQFREIAPRLPEHVNMIAMAAACLGLRVSEILGLQWSDIDWEKQTVSIRRSAYRGAIDDTKNNSSKAKLPLHPTLATLLLAWKIKWSEREELMQKRAALRKRKRPLKKNEFGWLFANPNTGMPYMSPSLQQRWIRPAGEAIGLEGLGFHSLRHSYRTWLDSAGVAHRIVARIPESLTFVDAASFPIGALTAWEAMFREQNDLPIGVERVLIVGGAGGVGSIATQLLKAETSALVISTASRPESREWCHEMGADLVIDHSKDIQEQLSAEHIEQVDMILSTAKTADNLPWIAKLLRPFGHLSVIDMSPSLNANALMLKSASLHMEMVFSKVLHGYDVESQGRTLEAVAALVAEGRIRPIATTRLTGLTPETMRAAHDLLESGRNIGKVVIATN